MIFVDSNILIDLSRPDGEWRAWSAAALRTRAVASALVIDHVVLAEIAVRFPSLASALVFVDSLNIAIQPIDGATAFAAGQAHGAYRRAGGERYGILADFLIGAHAQTLGATLMTRDRQRFASYFPGLALITPETHP